MRRQPTSWRGGRPNDDALTSHHREGLEFEIEFGRSGDGYLVARVGDTAFAMLPGRNARHYLASGWRINRPIAEWKRSDFYGHSGGLADEVAFRTKVLENAEHQREKRALGRRDAGSNANTPWGPSQGATVYAEGVVCHSTAGHGGFHLSAERNRKVNSVGSRPSYLVGWFTGVRSLAVS